MTKEQREAHNARQRKYESKPEVKARRKKQREARQNGHYVYYVPSIHTVGLTNDLYRREAIYRSDGVDTEGFRVLYHSMDRVEAAHHEALFQSVLGINGLNFK